MTQTQNRARTIHVFLSIAAMITSFVLFASSSRYAAGDGLNASAVTSADSEETSIAEPNASAIDSPFASPADFAVALPSDSKENPPEKSADLPEPPLRGDIYDAPPAAKCAYLTFDDGPSENTPRILDILDEYGVKATFFVCGTKYRAYYKDIVERGHTIALHANNHDYKVCYAGDEAYFNDLLTLQASVEQISGVHCRIIRFPGGSSNTVSNRYSSGLMKRLIPEVGSRGFIYHDWNVDSRDATRDNLPAQTIINNIYSDMQKKDIIDILMHDSGPSKNTTVEALPHIITMLLESGYTVLPITERTEPVQHHLK